MGSQGINAAVDGVPCQRLGVSIVRNRDHWLAPIIGSNSNSTAVSAVARINPDVGEGDVVPLILLEPTGMRRIDCRRAGQDNRYALQRLTRLHHRRLRWVRCRLQPGKLLHHRGSGGGKSALDQGDPNTNRYPVSDPLIRSLGCRRLRSDEGIQPNGSTD